MSPYSTSPWPRERDRAAAHERAQLLAGVSSGGMSATSRTSLPSTEELGRDADRRGPALDLAPGRWRQQRRSTRGPRPRRRRARRRAAPRASRRAPAAGPCRLPRSGSPTPAGVLGHRARGGDPRLELVAPVEAQRDPVRAGRQDTPPVPRPASGTGRSRHPSAGAGPGPSESNSTGMPARRPRSRVARRSVGTRPEVVEHHRPHVEDERLRRVERLLDHRDELADLARAEAGSRATSRSTICAWRTMFVRLWAGPSCIARAISRRRSSWAPRTRRDTADGHRRVVGRAAALGRAARAAPGVGRIADRGPRRPSTPM